MHTATQIPPTGDERAVADHYRVDTLAERIFGALQQMGKDLDALTPADLAPVDEFHSRGREATVALAEHAGIDRDTRVLDVGSGLGGSARFLADSYGCHVTGLDLTQEYGEVAAMLSARLGLDHLTTFRQSSALNMPFEDDTFDCVWTEHAQMNIFDKNRLYAEIARVLKPGGRLALHDVLQGPDGPPHFPVPWADEPSISALIAPDAFKELLKQTGFRIGHWDDVSRTSLAWFRQVSERIAAQGPPPLGLHLLMGAEARTKLANMMRSLDEGRVVVVQAVLEKTA